MSAESPRHVRSGGPLTVPSQPPSDRSIIDAVSGFINDVTLSSSSTVDPKDVIQWARFETADINEPTPEGDSDNEISPLLLILGYGSGVQVWLVPPSGEAQEVLSWRQGTVRVLRILPTPQHGDVFASKRPLIALCDSASPGPTFCSLSFISIRGGEQVKSIKFKNPILDVLANKRSVVVSFSERFAVFDAATLEDRMAITTCYPCPCPLGGSSPINPLTLGDRWLAYADKKLNQSKRSSGGCEGEGVTSYTATVLHAAKSLSKGLRGLGESVAHSLAGGRSTSQSPSPPNADVQQPGVVTILDIEGIEEEEGQDSEEPCDPIVAHFVAHSEAIIALKFDSSGMLLVTADRRGHDFHVFRINPHPCGPSLASVHHLYILHRGDTTAKVQDIAISSDSRWTAISTLRGTTHVFAISPYGGACGVRTHTVPRVVNRLSRFHRSAGLPVAHSPPARPNGSPVGDGLSAGAWFPNPRLPPYPQPTTATPLAQLRPTANLPTHTITRTSSGRQRLSSLSEDSNSVPLLARARFGLACGTATAVTAGGMGRGSTAPVTALYLVTASGTLLHLVLHPRAQTNVPKEKICDESPIEVTVEPVSQWALQRPPAAPDLLAPLPPANPLLRHLHRAAKKCGDICMSEEERWLSQVEIVTHAGPHRRLWMGPQFVFKTYNCNGSNSSLSEAETVEVEASASLGVARSNPVNMPGVRPIVPVLIDSGSASSLEHSPSDGFRRKSLLAEAGRAPSLCDVQLKEDLAEAMKEDHGCHSEEGAGRASFGVSLAVDPLGCVVRAQPPARDPARPPRDPARPPRDPDRHTRCNSDEATFRPVVRAPAALPPPALLLRPLPLPRTTTIPVQPLRRAPAPEPETPKALDTHRVIPAELQYAPSAHLLENAADDLPADVPDLKSGRIKTAAVVSDDSPTHLLENAADDSPRIERKSDPPAVESADDFPVRDVRERDPATCLENPPVDHPIDNTPERKRDLPSTRLLDTATEDVSARDVHPTERKRSPTARLLENASKSFPARDVRASREREPPLPKSKLPDIQPARSRVDESPTERSLPKSDVSFKVSEFSSEVTEPRAFETTIDIPELPPAPVISTTSVSSTKERQESKSNVRSLRDEEIKTEDQAWDMLLTEPPKPVSIAVREPIVEKAVEEPKPKSKKNRKSKKAQEEAQAKADDDSFVEIHTIEEKPQPSSGELVSISTPFEDVESCNSFFTRPRKTRVSKSLTPERLEEEKNVQLNYQDECKPIRSASISISKVDRKIDMWPQFSMAQKSTEVVKEKTKSNTLIVTQCEEMEDEILKFKESPKSRKSKSLSPYFDSRKSVEKIPDTEVKDVYVIDSTTEEFPEIQITRGTKLRKKSPQPIESRSQEKHVVTEQPVAIVEKPVQSWSSIAAWKGAKKPDELEKRREFEDGKVEKTNLDDRKLEKVDKKNELRDVARISDKKESSKEVSLHEKLYEVCKRRDIMVAECDAPSELNFVEEHHAVLHDLPPLEPLDFALDDFKLEVMRDSLLEVNDAKITSPICKINIDDILSSIKETTSKVIESSTFNLIDLEKVPAKKEKGFSVIGSHKITSHEIQLDDDLKTYEEAEIMEKSSDDDNTSPVVSTDSDKEDKKMGATKTLLPSTLKKTAKSKNSRRKKK